MAALEHLDVSYNLLMSHAALSPLLELGRLSSLLLSGNPLCCLSDHRRRTAQRLHHNCRAGQVCCSCFQFQTGIDPFTLWSFVVVGDLLLTRTYAFAFHESHTDVVSYV